MTKPTATRKPIPIELQTAVRDRDGTPFVHFTLGAEAIMMDLDEARSLAALLLEFAAIAEQESVLVRASAGLGVQPLDLVNAVAQERKRMKGKVH